MNTMRKGKFKIESMPGQVFLGFTDDEEWNGWACPYFSFEESRKIVNAHIKTGQKASYVESSDEFQFEIAGDDESYQAIEFEGQKLYPIGNSNWIWEEIINNASASLMT